MAIRSTILPGADPGTDNSVLLPPALVRELQRALQSIRYGTVELVIHDGQVVQLERREKLRLVTEVMERKK